MLGRTLINEPDPPRAGRCPAFGCALGLAPCPAAVDDEFVVNGNSSRTLAPLANDTDAKGNSMIDPETVTIVGQPSHGTVTVNDNGAVTYTSTIGAAS
ncbi:Ig-like domain-containing protein [Mycolicibacterium smegmatis]|nr:Ig-like domain-containing protein [Mycolicibacterium smegmatis]